MPSEARVARDQRLSGTASRFLVNLDVAVIFDADRPRAYVPRWSPIFV